MAFPSSVGKKEETPALLDPVDLILLDETLRFLKKQ